MGTCLFFLGCLLLLFPEGLPFFRCKHDWEYDRAEKDTVWIGGSSISTTQHFYKCKKCGAIKAI